MDRTAWIVVILCSGLLFFWFQKSAKDAEEYRKAVEEQQAKEAAENPEPETTDDPEVAGETPATVTPQPSADVTEAVLKNRLSRYTFTNQGAGIVQAELLDHPRYLDSEDEYVAMNYHSPYPIGAISSGPKEIDQAIWEIRGQTETEIVFATETPEGLIFEKRFKLPEPDEEEHLLRMAITIRNQEGNPEQRIERDFLYLGSAAPLHPDEWARQSGMFWIGATGGMKYKNVDYFKGGGFLGMGGAPKPHDEFAVEGMRWAGVNDQFFTTLVKPETPHDATIWGSRFPIEIKGAEEESRKKKLGAIEAAIGLPALTLAPGDQQTLRYELYIGPKEFSRLKGLGDDRTLVMNYTDVPIFGWLFGWALKPLAQLLIWGLVSLKGVVGQFGIAIILITIIIRIIIWPVYAKSTRTMKRMSKLNPKMTELREKYKDDQQKQSQEMMKLYKDYGVNPLGGCLPMFIQMPVFLAFYGMLWRAVEVRHEPFLWVDDLSMPDTLFEIAGFPINLLPIVMALTTFIQMSMTPKTGDKTQRMIFMLMPFFFLVICYNFASALALYWTTQNIFSIGQTWLMNKLPEPELKKSKRAKSGKKGFMQRLQEQAAAAQKAKEQGGGKSPGLPGADRSKSSLERGERHTKSKKRKKR